MFKIVLCALSLSFTSLSFATINRFSKVDPGVFRGAQPQVVSDYQFLKASGIKTVINLRETPLDITAEATIAHELGFIFRSYPMDGEAIPNPKEVSQILIDLNTRALLPIFIHCQEGKDRTGMIIGLYRVKTDRWDPNRAYQEMISFGFDPNLKGLYNFFWSAVKTQNYILTQF